MSSSFPADQPILLPHDTDTDEEIEDVAMLDRYCKWIEDEAARGSEAPSILSDSFMDFVRLLWQCWNDSRREAEQAQEELSAERKSLKIWQDLVRSRVKKNVSQKPVRKENGTHPLVTCPVCWEADFRAAAVPCGHLFCSSCLEAVKKSTSTCPQCRVKISDVLPIYY